MDGDGDAAGQVTLPALTVCPSQLYRPLIAFTTTMKERGRARSAFITPEAAARWSEGEGERERGRRKSFCREDFDVFTMRRGQSRWSRSPAAATNRKSGREETEMGSFLTNSTERRNGQIYQCTNA